MHMPMHIHTFWYSNPQKEHGIYLLFPDVQLFYLFVVWYIMYTNN